MPNYRIHRMKEAPRQTFRWAPHTAGSANVKPKDYEPADVIEANNEYAAWAGLRSSERPLDLGDLLETETGELLICKYVGFESARWILPEPPLAIRRDSPDQPFQESNGRKHGGSAIRRHYRRLLHQVPPSDKPFGGIDP